MPPTPENYDHAAFAERYPLLATIDGPSDLKTLELEQLEQLAEEIRQTIIEVASKNGGHLASPLGAVELAIALHYVYDFSQDFLIWDVGHQAHAHKILTGRRDRIHTLRRKTGLSGYPSRSESPYDVFGTGHASTSISAALGMAVAAAYKKGDERRAVAVIGDGPLPGGMAFGCMPMDDFNTRVNADSIIYQPVQSAHWETVLKNLVAEHHQETRSAFAGEMLINWDRELGNFIQICPKEMIGRLEHALSDEASARTA